MRKLIFKREKNYLTIHRPYKIFLDNQFIDYIEPKEKIKEIEINNSAKELKIFVNKFSSNIVELENGCKTNTFNITSQIQNGLFVFIFLCFFGGLLLRLFGIIKNPLIVLVSILPFAIIVYWQTIGRSNYLRLTKLN